MIIMTKMMKMKEVEKIKKNFIVCYLEFLLLNFSKKYLFILKIRGQKNVDSRIFTVLNYGITTLQEVSNAKNFSDKAKLFNDLESPLVEIDANYWLLLKESPEYLKLVQELINIVMISKSQILQNKFFYRFYKYYALKTKETNKLINNKKEINLINNINNILLEIKLYEHKIVPLYKFNILNK